MIIPGLRRGRTSYETNRHIQNMGFKASSLHISYTDREIYGRSVKERVKKKWHKRYLRESYSYKEYARGRFVYTYSEEAWIQRPRKKLAHRMPLNYAAYLKI